MLTAWPGEIPVSSSTPTVLNTRVPHQPTLSGLLVPVAFGVPIERRKHDREDTGSVVTDEAHDVLIVPVVEGALCHLSRRSAAQHSRPALPSSETVGLVSPGNGGWRHTWQAGGRGAPSLC